MADRDGFIGWGGLLFIAAAALACLLIATRCPAQTIQHVVVVMLDDVGVDKVAAYGEHETAGPTPRLDGMAENGLLFRSCYANPSCSTSRAAALTGRYGSRTGIDIAIDHHDPDGWVAGDFAPSDEESWLAGLLSTGGVRTYAVGKWHLTHVEVEDYQEHPLRAGFDKYAGALGGFPAGQTYYWWERTVATSAGWSQSTSTIYATMHQANDALNQLLAAADAELPSFHWIAFSAAHEPWTPNPPPGTYTAVFGTEAWKKQQMMLESLDYYLGALVDAYEDLRPEAAADTLWIVLGDNGTPNSAVESPWPSGHNKGTAFQGGIRVPMIAFGAGVEAGETDELVHVVDLWATALELLDVEPPEGQTDSISFASVLGGGTGGRSAVYARHAYPNGFGAKTVLRHCATDGAWKVMETVSPAGTVWHLYDLVADPFEATNLWPPDEGEEQDAVDVLLPVLEAGEAGP